MQKLFSPVLALLLILSVCACRSNKEELVLKGNDYFPLKTGVIRLYEIDSFIYNNYTGDIDTFNRNFREEIKNFFVDNAGDTNYTVDLSYYNTVRVKWEVQQSYVRKISGNYAVENIYNRPEVKLLFPISKYKTKGASYVWNLNMFNDGEGSNVKYTAVFTPFDNSRQAFNDCVKVEYQKPETGVVNNVYEEVYAKNVGLVYRHIDRSDYLTQGKRGGYEIFVRLLP